MFKTHENNLGRINTKQGGFYPATGFIGNAGVFNFSLLGYYWNADCPLTGSATHFRFNNSSITASSNAWITYAYPIRCVKE